MKEHTEELCRLKYAHWTEGEAAASLHRELKAKDQELRQLQMSMDQWKQQTTAHLADSITEKLIPELERSLKIFILTSYLINVLFQSWYIRHATKQTFAIPQLQVKADKLQVTPLFL